jgi:hypothetical protein
MPGRIHEDEMGPHEAVPGQPLPEVPESAYAPGAKPLDAPAGPPEQTPPAGEQADKQGGTHDPRTPPQPVDEG